MSFQTPLKSGQFVGLGAGFEMASDGTMLRHLDRPQSKNRPLKAIRHFRILLKDKDKTEEVFKLFEALPPIDFEKRVRELTMSPHGEALRASEPFLPPMLDDHKALRKLPKGSVAQAYCDFMEREGLTAAGLVAEDEQSGRKTWPDLIQWYANRQRDTHDLLHVLTGYGRDVFGEQCVLLVTYGQNPSLAHLFIGYAGSVQVKRLVTGKPPVMKAARQAHKTGLVFPTLVGLSIRELLAMNLEEARKKLNIPEPTLYNECHRIMAEEGIDPFSLLKSKE